MNFNIQSLIFTVGCCLLSLIISGSSANKNGREWFAGLKHPDNSFIENAMPIIGLVFYGSFGYVLYNLCVSGDIIAIALVTAVILLNGITAFLLY
jgi:tryptophan-rich sensory protein